MKEVPPNPSKTYITIPSTKQEKNLKEKSEDAKCLNVEWYAIFIDQF